MHRISKRRAKNEKGQNQGVPNGVPQGESLWCDMKPKKVLQSSKDSWLISWFNECIKAVGFQTLAPPFLCAHHWIHVIFKIQSIVTLSACLCFNSLLPGCLSLRWSLCLCAPEAKQRPYYADYSPLRLSIHTLCTSHYLDLFITFIICINVFTMSIEHYNQPQVSVCDIGTKSCS